MFDYDIDHGKAEWEGMKPNGFSFDGVDEGAIDYALDRAISLAYDKPQEFRALQANCMTQDWSWNRPALEYIEIHHAARGRINKSLNLGGGESGESGEGERSSEGTAHEGGARTFLLEIG